MRKVVTILLTMAALWAAFFMPALAGEMVNGAGQHGLPEATFEPLAVVPLGPGETIVAFQVTKDGKSALAVIHIWPGGRNLVVMPW